MSSLFSGTSSAPPTLQPASPRPAPVPVSGPGSSSLAPLTQDQVKQALPSHLRTAVTQSLVDTLNSISNDPIVVEDIRKNFIGYTAVLKEGKFKTEDYVHAIAYVSFKVMGHNNEEAYARAFPQRYAALIAKGTSKKDISAYVSAYNKGKLVNLILEQTLVPTWVLNQDLYQKAINIQAELMVGATSEKVRTDAANSLLTHLKKPETKEFQVNINADNSGMREMQDMLARLAAQQRELISQGQARTIDIAAAPLIDRTGATDV